jgi:hypothetical protein
MAQLPPDGRWLVQQDSGVVTVFDRHTQEEIIKVDPGDADAMARAQQDIYDSDRLSAEQKCFAHFWCGYFYAHAGVSLDA